MNQNTKTWNTRELILCALFSALIAIGAYIKVPIPVVPFTLQFLFTNLAGLLLGKKYGTISVMLYLFVGLIGIPVFAGGGGPGYIFQPTFGYLIGFMAGTWLTGYLVGRVKQNGFKNLLLAGFAGLAVVYIFGMVYYYFIANYYMDSPIGIWSLLLYCFILSVPGDIALCFVSAVLVKRLLPVIKREKG